MTKETLTAKAPYAVSTIGGITVWGIPIGDFLQIAASITFVLIAIATCIINWYYKHSEERRRREVHALRLDDWDGNTERRGNCPAITKTP